MATMGPENLTIGFAAATDQANLLTTLALAIVGGSIIALLQTSYLRPENRLFRAVYLIFVPGWYFLGKSIFYGSQVRAVHISYLFSSIEDDTKLIEAVGQATVNQSNCVLLGLLTFAIWLALYLAWWIYADRPTGGS